MERRSYLHALLLLTVAACSCAGAACSSVDFEVVAARELGVLETTSAIQGRDGGYSGLFRGRSVWLYGDTILSLVGEDGSSWRHNSWSWTEDLDASDGITGFEEPTDALGAPEEFFPKTDPERAFNEAHDINDCREEPCGARRVFWPGPIVEDAERDRALVFYGKIYGEPGEWNFYGLGCGVAVWTDFDARPERPEVRPGTDEPTLLWTADEAFCASAALIEDGLLYAFSCIRNPDKPCHLGRVAPANVLDPAAWRYWDGEGWSPDVGDAEGLFEGMDMMTVHHNAHLGRYLAVYSEPFSTRVVLRMAPRVEGPWSDTVLAFQAREAQGDGFPYSGLGHAEFQRAGGRFEYVSYYRATGDWTGEVRLVELELAAGQP